MLNYCKKFLIEKGMIKKGEMFIMTAGVPIGITGTTNMIRIECI